MRVVVALGGNALLQRGEPMTDRACSARTSGRRRPRWPRSRGARAGALPRQRTAGRPAGAAGRGVHRCGAVPARRARRADPGHDRATSWSRSCATTSRRRERFATILTMVEVDPADPAFEDPTKFVGPVYTEDQADEARRREGLAVQAGRRRWRRVVPSPRAAAHLRDGADPRRCSTRTSWSSAPAAGECPTMVTHRDGRAHLMGVEAVIDKDLASRAARARDRRRRVRDGHRRRRGLRRLGDPGPAAAGRGHSCGAAGHASSRRGRWGRRSRPPRASSRRPASAPPSAASAEIEQIVEGKAGTQVSSVADHAEKEES